MDRFTIAISSISLCPFKILEFWDVVIPSNFFIKFAEDKGTNNSFLSEDLRA